MIGIYNNFDPKKYPKTSDEIFNKKENQKQSPDEMLSIFEGMTKG